MPAAAFQPVASTAASPPDSCHGPRLSIHFRMVGPLLPSVWLRSSMRCSRPQLQVSMSLPSLEVSSQRASVIALASSWSRSVGCEVSVVEMFHQALPASGRIWRTTSNQRSPPSGCACDASRWPHSVTSCGWPRLSTGPVPLTGATRRHWPLGRTSLGSLLPKASLRVLRHTALKYAAAAESASWSKSQPSSSCWAWRT